MNASDLQKFVNAAMAQGAKHDLAGADLTAYVALTLKFGTHFALDPLHDWARPAYHAPHPSADEQRLALAKGMTTYLARFEAREEDDIDG
jgi:hypothetical protein